jgi:putative DNA primase/helicase
MSVIDLSRNLDNIPQELKSLCQWVVSKADKHPRRINNLSVHASVDDPSSWNTFERACEAVEQKKALGIGFVFTDQDPYVAIDLDKCIKDDVIEDWAAAIIKKLDSYTEVSRSGHGIHILARGKKPTARCRRDSVEIYDKRRYFILTGDLWEERGVIEDRQEELDWLCKDTFDDTGAANGAAAPEISVILDKDAEPPKDKLKALLKKKKEFRSTWMHKNKKLKSLSDYDWRLALIAYEEGWSDQEIADLIIAFRREKGDDKDLKKALRRDYISGTISKLKSGGLSRTKYPLTEMGNAEMLSMLHSKDLKYDHKRKKWLRWAGHTWKPDRDGYIARIAMNIARLRKEEAEKIEDKKAKIVVAKWASASESRARVDACISLASKMEAITDAGSGWDANTMVLGAENGIIDLRTGNLRDGVPDDHISMSVGMDYDPDAKSPRWMKFLEEIFDGDADLIDWIWRVLGYSLTGDTTEHIIFIGFGEGANGKSRFFNAVCSALGNYSYSCPFQTFSMPPSSSTNDIAGLENRRFVISSETNIGTKLNMERIKALSGEDPISARFLYKEFETFVPHLKMWLFVNHKPEIEDDTIATWRRVRLVPFTKTFIGKADSRLGEKLRAEAQGILAWLVKGCLEWEKRGLAPIPQSVEIATGEYRRESDTVLGFISELCEVGKDEKVKAEVLYSVYRSYAKSEGRALTQTAFGKRMKSLRYEKGRDKDGRIIYIGLCLKDKKIRVNMSE